MVQFLDCCGILNKWKKNMNDRVYNRGVDPLRSPERVARLEVKRVVDNCLINSNITSVLDIGTGSGLFAEEFSKRGLKVAAIDPNPEMIIATQNILPNIDIRKASAEEIPFEDNSFDLVFMGLVFHEVDDYSKTIEETFRISNKEVSLLEWEYLEQDFGPPLKHRLKSSFIEELAEKAGFKKVEIIKLTNLILYKLYK
jgi:ubiquinone/menaquinone biosynthesis C-methylase UbiE